MTTHLIVKDDKSVNKPNPFEITSFAEAERYAKIIADSDFAPKDFKGKPGNVMIAMQMGHELGLKPMQAIQNIAVVNGRPMVWGDAALALVRSNPECHGIKEWMDGTIKGGDAIAYCEVKRGKEIILREFSVKQATQAGLLGNNVWAKYPERMLQMRARGYAIRDSFPDVLKGVYIEGEILEEEEETTPKQSSSMGVNSLKEELMERKKKLASQLRANTVASKKMEVEIIDEETGEIINPVNDSGAPTFDEVKSQMETAKTVDDLILAADAARCITLPEDLRKELTELYRKKQKELK